MFDGPGDQRFVLGLLTSQFLRMLVNGSQPRWDLYVVTGLGDGVPAALVRGLSAGVAAALTLRLTASRTETTDATASAQP